MKRENRIVKIKLLIIVLILTVSVIVFYFILCFFFKKLLAVKITLAIILLQLLRFGVKWIKNSGNGLS